MEIVSGDLMLPCWDLSLNVQILGGEYLDGSTKLHAQLLARMGGTFDQKFY